MILSPLDISNKPYCDFACQNSYLPLQQPTTLWTFLQKYLYLYRKGIY